MSIKFERIEAQEAKGKILSSTDNCDFIAHAVRIGAKSEGETQEIWCKVAKPKNFAGIFEAQSYHEKDSPELSDSQNQAIALFTKAFTGKVNGKSEVSERVRSLMQGYFDDLKLSVQNAVRNEFGPEGVGISEELKAHVDAFLSMVETTPKLQGLSREEQYARYAKVRAAIDETAPDAAELIPAIETIEKRRAASRKARESKKN